MIKTYKLRKSQSGFGLVEVMVVVGVMGIVALGTASLFSDVFKMNNTSKFQTQTNALHEDIRSMMGKQADCTASLAPLNIDLKQNVTDHAVTELQNAGGTRFFRVGETHGDRSVRITGIRLHSYKGEVDDTSQTGYAVLEMTYTSALTANGPQDLIRTISLVTQKAASGANPHRLTMCLASSKLGDSLWLKSTSNLDNIHYSAGKVGIGTDNPAQILDVVNLVPNEGISASGHYNDGESVNMTLRRSRGTAAIPTALTNGDEVGQWFAQGRAANGSWPWLGGLMMRVDTSTAGNPNPVAGASVPSKLQLYTLSKNEALSTAKLTIANDGSVGIGVDNPGENNRSIKLQVANPFSNDTGVMIHGVNNTTVSAHTQNSLTGADPGGFPNFTLARMADSGLTPSDSIIGGLQFQISTGGYWWHNVASVYAHAGTLANGTSYPSALSFATTPTGTTTLTEKMRLTSEGRLGIGMQVPEARLDVAGNVRAVAPEQLGMPTSLIPNMVGAGGAGFYQGLGINLEPDRTTGIWRNGGDGVHSGASAILMDHQHGDMRMVVIANDPGWVYGKTHTMNQVLSNERMRIYGANASTGSKARVRIGPEYTPDMMGNRAKPDLQITSPTDATVHIIANQSQPGSWAGIDLMRASNTTDANRWDISVKGNDPGMFVIRTKNDDATAEQDVLQFERDKKATFWGDVHVNGNLTATGTITPSDARLKSDVKSFNLGLDTLLGVVPRTFKYNGLGGMPASEKPVLGVIAQELEVIAPSLIVTKEVTLHQGDKQKTEIKQVNYTAFTYMLINAVKELYQRWFADSQELHREVASVKAENVELKRESSAMKAYLCAKDPGAPFCQ